MEDVYILGILSSVCLDIYPGVGLCGHFAIWCFIFWEISTSLFITAMLLHIPSVQAVCSAHHQQIFLIWAVSAGVRRYLIVLLICISINISDFEHFYVPVRAEKHPFSSFNHIKIRSFVCACNLLAYVSNVFWILTPYQIYT